MANYGKYNYYTITDLSFKKAEEIFVQNDINMLKYYQQKYKIHVQQPAQPLL